jgi:nitroimidazol reductase NimA-like FMN-containing flavoprotein (pyridoxamine 5'-phosphate oxidase superfamily)
MGRMSPEEVERFLTPHGSCMLACLEPDGGPYGLPIGYIYAAEWFYFRGRERAAWAL